MREYPGLRYLPVVSGQPLPFKDREFDIVFSNAVLEHVGSRDAQARFVAELRRVSKALFITTPNRWFPFEHHTGLPFLHYLPPALFRALIRNTRYRHWADEANLNILTVPGMAKLFPGAGIHIEMIRNSRDRVESSGARCRHLTTLANTCKHITRRGGSSAARIVLVAPGSRIQKLAPNREASPSPQPEAMTSDKIEG